MHKLDKVVCFPNLNLLETDSHICNILDLISIEILPSMQDIIHHPLIQDFRTMGKLPEIKNSKQFRKSSWTIQITKSYFYKIFCLSYRQKYHVFAVSKYRTDPLTSYAKQSLLLFFETIPA